MISILTTIAYLHEHHYSRALYVVIHVHINGVNSVAERSFGKKVIGSAVQSYTKHSLHKGNPVICLLQHTKKSIST